MTYDYKLLASNSVSILKKSPAIKRYGVFLLSFLLTFYLVINLLKTSPDNLVIDFNTTEEHLPLADDEIEFDLEECGCKRRLSGVHQNPPRISYNQTTCSLSAFHRGPHQKIVGFSFYGDINSDYSKKKGYFEGIVGNLELMPKYYPGWVMRLYYDLDRSDPVFKDLCDLACQNNILDICDAKHLPGTPFVDTTRVFAMNWRFFPTLDPQVDFYASRDLDSRFNDREQAAVNEWLQSEKFFHIMRDHPHHGTHMLGASWGSKINHPDVRKRWQEAWKKGFADKMVWAKRNDYGPDQQFLSRYVWPWAKSIAISHDSYTCKSYPYTQAWPVQRINEPNNFVASVVQENHTLWQPCPKACRPKNHLDWKYC